MMKPTASAAMSGPERKRCLRRRWQGAASLSALQSTPMPTPADPLDLAGRALLEQGRRERAQLRGERRR